MSDSFDHRDVTRNDSRSRYELGVDGQLSGCDYGRSGNTVAFTHTEVPEALEGQGVGSALARGALNDARAQGLTVIPACAFVANFIHRHAEYQDLLSPDASALR